MFSGLFYPIKGCLFFVGHPHLWKHVIKSTLMSILLFIVLGGIANKLYTLHIANVPFMKKIIMITILVIISIIVFFSLNSLLTARFMKALSRHVERIVLEKEIEEPSVSFGQIIVGIFKSIRAIPFLIFIIILNFVPVIGQVITFYFLGKSYVSFSMELREDVKKDPMTFIAFGIVATTMMMIPPFTVIAHPMCVVGGTLMTLEKIDYPES